MEASRLVAKLPRAASTDRHGDDAVATAGALAGRAQARAGVTIRELDDMPALAEASELFREIWGKNPDLGPPINADLLRALSHSGNYVAGAFDEGGVMRGALVGFLGADAGAVHLHSHILGIRASNQVRGAGFALKLHQRWWALARVYDTIEWTFDPLVRRNAYFNLTKLGADMDRYLVNFYGVMDDAQNRREESDRVLVRWDLLGARAQAAAAGAPGDPAAVADGASPLHLLRVGTSGEPVASGLDGARFAVIEVPDDIIAMRTAAPDMARRWRFALREAVTSVVDAGYRCHGASRGGNYIFGR
jgi:predicted GNAT superfamily acetyltransferase